MVSYVGSPNLIITGSLSWNHNLTLQGFSTSNYATTPSAPPTVNSYEIVIRFKASSTPGGRIFGNSITNIHSPQLNSNESNAQIISFGHPKSDHTWHWPSYDYTWTANQWYWFKAVWDGGTLKQYVSTDAASVTPTWTLLSNTVITTCGWDEALNIGADDNGYMPFSNGSIDLRNCYIKINGNLWWTGAKEGSTIKSFIQNDIKYYKYQYSTFTQPSLSGNGSMGGTSWAVAGKGSGGTPDANNPYQAVYPQTGTYNIYNKGGQPSLTVTMYTPNPTVITSATFTALWGNYSDSYVNIRFRASNDNNTWTTLYPQASLHEGTQTITFNNSNTYKYYELYVLTTGGGYHDGIRLSSIKLTGQNKVSIAGTANDYDYTTTTSTYKIFKCTQSNTNCLTYIPNDINLTLSNGTLTLKAGSKVYLPNGNSYILPNDVTRTGGSANKTQMIFFSTGGYFRLRDIDKLHTGSTAPSSPNYHTWWDTTNKVINFYDSPNMTGDKGYVPLGLCTSDSNGTITTINQLFNGFGYMGNIIYCLPGVKGLIPDGKNSDGSNNCIEATTTSLQTYSHSTTWTRTNHAIYLNPTGATFDLSADDSYFNYIPTDVSSRTWTVYLDTNTNKLYRSNGTAGNYSQQNACFAGLVTMTLGIYSNLRVATPQSETIPHYKAFSV